MHREKLPLDAVIEGPAILEQMDATTVHRTRRPCARRTPTATLIIDIGEALTMAALDAITLSVIQAALQQVCDEMDLTFSRAAFSPVIAEANDRSDGIYSADDGSLIAQGAGGLPVFVGVMQYSTRTHHRDDRATAAACRRSPATSTSSTIPISAARI